jgi:4-amino-4-deoxy-L-arabinose transferase-like glycosyltransferase
MLKNGLLFSLLVLLIAAWIAGLFIDLTGDAGLYATISRQMVESGDWLNLKINGEPYDQKPHLLFWLAGAGISIFGNSNFAFKLFPVLFALSGIYFTYRLAKLMFSETAGRLAALFTATSQMFLLYFFDIHTDTVLQAAIMLSLWQLAAYLQNNKLIHFIAGFAGLGLAMFAKGPVGAVLPFFFVFFYLLLKKEYRQLYDLKWFAGIFISFLVIFPALYHLWESFGLEGLRFYFIDNNIGRVTGKVTGTSTDPFFYLYNLLWALLPWTIPVLAGLTMEIRSWFRKGTVHAMSASLLGSVLLLLIVFSTARGKAPNYMMPLIAPMAVVAAGNLLQVVNQHGKRLKLVFNSHVLLMVLLLLLFAGTAFLVNHNWLLFALLLIVSAFLVVLYFRVEYSAMKRLLFLSVAIAVAMNLFLNVKVVPVLFSYQGARQALEVYERQRSEHGVLKNLQLEEYELFFMAQSPVEGFSGWEDFYAHLDSKEPWVYTNLAGLNVVKELKNELDTVYAIPQRGMNELSLQFIHPHKREASLKENYLIKVR